MAMYIVGRAAAGPWISDATEGIIPREVLDDVGIGTLTPASDIDSVLGVSASGLAIKNELAAGVSMVLMEQFDANGTNALAFKNKEGGTVDKGWAVYCSNGSGLGGRLAFYNTDPLYPNNLLVLHGLLPVGHTYAGAPGPVVIHGNNGYTDADVYSALQLQGQGVAIESPFDYDTTVEVDFAGGNCSLIDIGDGINPAGDLLLSNPVNGIPGGCYNITVKQDGVGGRAITFGADFLFSGGSAPTMDTTASSYTVISLVCIETFPTSGVRKFLTSIVSGIV